MITNQCLVEFVGLEPSRNKDHETIMVVVTEALLGNMDKEMFIQRIKGPVRRSQASLGLLGWWRVPKFCSDLYEAIKQNARVTISLNSLPDQMDHYKPSQSFSYSCGQN